MSSQEIDIVCLNIENIFKSAIQTFVPEIRIPSCKVNLSTRSLNLIKKKKKVNAKKI